MVKHYCDGCGDEVPEHSHGNRHYAEKEFQNKSKITIEILVAVDGTWNGGVVCKKCLKALLNQTMTEEEWERSGRKGYMAATGKTE